MMPLGRGGCHRRTAAAPQTPALSVPAPIPVFLFFSFSFSFYSSFFFLLPSFSFSFSAAAGLAAGYRPESNFISSHLIKIQPKSRPEIIHSLIIHYSLFIIHSLFLLSITISF
jgi:hypothetical protein